MKQTSKDTPDSDQCKVAVCESIDHHPRCSSTAARTPSASEFAREGVAQGGAAAGGQPIAAKLTRYTRTLCRQPFGASITPPAAGRGTRRPGAPRCPLRTACACRGTARAAPVRETAIPAIHGE